MEYLWELTYGDYRNPKSVMVPPDSVAVVKRRWDAGSPIHTSAGSIPARDIRGFEMSATPHSDQHLLEAASQAFREPEYNEDGSTIVEWVKKVIPQPVYQKRYDGIPAYRILSNVGGLVTIAFRLPVHEINLTKVEQCTDEEVNSLTRR